MTYNKTFYFPHPLVKLLFEMFYSHSCCKDSLLVLMLNILLVSNFKIILLFIGYNTIYVSWQIKTMLCML